MTTPSFHEIGEKLRKLQADVDILNARLEKMHKTDKQWMELIIGASAIAFLGTGVILGSIFLTVFTTFR